MKKKVAVIGAGLQAKRRIPAIVGDPGYELVYIVDVIKERADSLATQYKAKSLTDWKEAIADKSIDIVVVLTFPDSHAEISIAAMENGKDVLCEKPLARTVEEADRMVAVALKTKKILKTGFNHRHHPAFLKAYQIFKEGGLGKPLFGRARYGIAGRSGAEKEWRSNPKIIGGGQLMDQGIHLIDLYRWFLGDFSEATGMVSTNYWPVQPMEDNGFGLLKSKDGVIVSLHSTTTQWINLFDFEIGMEKGSINIQGLGASYGNEKLVICHRDPEGPFTYETFEFRGQDVSWHNEWLAFTEAIDTKQQPMGNGQDGASALKIVYDIYEAAKTGKIIRL